MRTLPQKKFLILVNLSQELVPGYEYLWWTVSMSGWKETRRKKSQGQSLECILPFFIITQILGSYNKLLHMWVSLLPKKTNSTGPENVTYTLLDIQKTCNNYHNYFVPSKPLNLSPYLYSVPPWSHMHQKIISLEFNFWKP